GHDGIAFALELGPRAGHDRIALALDLGPQLLLSSLDLSGRFFEQTSCLTLGVAEQCRPLLRRLTASRVALLVDVGQCRAAGLICVRADTLCLLAKSRRLGIALDDPRGRLPLGLDEHHRAFLRSLLARRFALVLDVSPRRAPQLLGFFADAP